MCTLIIKKENVLVDKDDVNELFSYNDDGFGMMFVENDRVKVIKGMFGLDQIAELFEQYKDKTFAAHFRMATSGLRDETNCHPFKIVTKEENGYDLYMMHGGVFHSKARDQRSDTNVFAEEMRNDILNGFNIFDKKHQEDLADKIGYNRLIFMTDRNRIITINGSNYQRNGVTIV